MRQREDRTARLTKDLDFEKLDVCEEIVDG